MKRKLIIAAAGVLATLAALPAIIVVAGNTELGSRVMVSAMGEARTAAVYNAVPETMREWIIVTMAGAEGRERAALECVKFVDMQILLRAPWAWMSDTKPEDLRFVAQVKQKLDDYRVQRDLDGCMDLLRSFDRYADAMSWASTASTFTKS